MSAALQSKKTAIRNAGNCFNNCRICPKKICSFCGVREVNSLKTVQTAIVITNCTNRKLQSSGAGGAKVPVSGSSIDALAETWRKALSEVEGRYVASELYAGRAFREAEAAAKLLSGPLYVASAGLGLIAATDLVPTYDLTVSESGPSVLPVLKRLGLQPARWWAAVNGALGKPQPIAALMRQHPRAVVYVAMPATYLALIGAELEALPKADQSRLRIFSSPAWQREAAGELASSALPYDDRLESTEFSGTRSDFPQRALRHFVQALQGHALDRTNGIAVVKSAMTRQALRVLPERQKRTDEEICSLLRLHWHANAGSGTRLLRVLRDDLLIKCEQSRFRDLWRTVRAEMEQI